MKETWKKYGAAKKLESLGPIGILVLIIAVLFVTTPAFRNANNFTQILLSASVYMMLARVIFIARAKLFQREHGARTGFQSSARSFLPSSPDLQEALA